MSLWAKVWAVRVLVIVGITFLCSLVESGNPAFAFALTWGPNGLFLVAFMRGTVRLPQFLEPVHPMEPVLYRWVGVTLVKRLVTTRFWPLLVSMEPSWTTDTHLNPHVNQSLPRGRS